MPFLLISPNRELRPDPVFLLGLASIAAGLKDRGWSVQVNDRCFSLLWKDTLNQALNDFQLDSPGLSIGNIDHVTYPFDWTFQGMKKCPS
jgi:hypothetical protein